MRNDTRAGSIYEDVDRGETLISLKAATRHALFSPNGKPCDFSVVYRAAAGKGKKTAGGQTVRLETIRGVSGGRVTTASAIVRFSRALNGNSAPAKPIDRDREFQQAEAALAAMGI